MDHAARYMQMLQCVEEASHHVLIYIFVSTHTYTHIHCDNNMQYIRSFLPVKVKVATPQILHYKYYQLNVLSKSEVLDIKSGAFIVLYLVLYSILQTHDYTQYNT